MAYSVVGCLVAMLVASKNIHHPSRVEREMGLWETGSMYLESNKMATTEWEDAVVDGRKACVKTIYSPPLTTSIRADMFRVCAVLFMGLLVK